MSPPRDPRTDESDDGDADGDRGANTDAGRDGDADVVTRRRERDCVRCAATFVERRGEVTRLCPSCDPDHVVLD